ncbi:MAG TPA: hypothetical protein VF003_16490 [Pseudonocardiaceae bacterium]
MARSASVGWATSAGTKSGVAAQRQFGLSLRLDDPPRGRRSLTHLTAARPLADALRRAGYDKGR